MKIIVTVRTRNEARNIARFCLAYAWADLILVADGGSEDETVKIAQTFGNVKVDLFTPRVERGSHWHNPIGQHINFVVNWAKAEAADWIIFDDCDCVPTLALQRDARGLMADTAKTVIEIYRLYIWGSAEYFPDMNIPGQSLWAWRTGMPIKWAEADPWQHHVEGWNHHDALKLEPPCACLHYFCPDEATTEAKLKFNHETNIEADAPHPLQRFGHLATLPEWAKWR